MEGERYGNMKHIPDFRISRPALAGLYVGTYAAGAAGFSLFLGAPQWFLLGLLYFPVGIAQNFGISLNMFRLSDSSPVSWLALAYGHLLYISLATAGVVTKKRFLYYLLLLMMVFNVRGCLSPDKTDNPAGAPSAPRAAETSLAESHVQRATNLIQNAGFESPAAVTIAHTGGSGHEDAPQV